MSKKQTKKIKKTKKTEQRNITVTKNDKKNTPLATKLLVLNKAIACLTEVIEATRDECKRRRKAFNGASKIYDPNNVVFMLDETFRQVKWLNGNQREYLEINCVEVCNDDENIKYYDPSCVIVNDLLIYIIRLADLMSDIGSSAGII